MESIIISPPIGTLQNKNVVNFSLRLVMPPTLFIALAYPWYILAHTIFPYYVAMAIYSGGIAGYIAYDTTHYFLHHQKSVSLA